MSTILLTHCNGSNGSTTFVDETGTCTLTAQYGAVISTAQKKFGTGSCAFAGGYETLKATNIPALAGDFTFEGWFYSVGGGITLFDFRISTGPVVTLTQDGSGNCSIEIYDPTSGLYTGGGITAYSLNAWHHYAVVRSSGALKVYVDGSDLGYGGTMGTTLGASCNIGANNGNSAMNGYLDEIRISDMAIYTTNFTPPTSEFTYGGSGGPVTTAQGVSLSGLTAVVVAKRTGMAIPLVGTSAAGLRRRSNKVFSVSSAAMAALAAGRAILRTVAATCGSGATVARSIGRIIFPVVASATGSARSVFKRLAVASSISTIAARLRSALISIAATAVTSGLIIKSTTKRLLINIASVVFVKFVRAIVAIIDVAIATATSVRKGVARAFALGAAVGTVGARAAGKGLAANAALTVTVAPSTRRLLAIAAACGSAVAAVAQKIVSGFTVTISAVVGTTVGIRKAALKGVVAFAATSANMLRQTGRQIFGSGVSNVATAKEAGKRVAAVVGGALTVKAGLAYRATLALAATSSVLGTRATGKLMQVTVRGAMVPVLLIAKSLQSALLGAIQVRKAIAARFGASLQSLVAIVTGNPFVRAPIIQDRIAFAAAEDRSIAVAAEERIAFVTAENRLLVLVGVVRKLIAD